VPISSQTTLNWVVPTIDGCHDVFVLIDVHRSLEF
jgi:hypothetical protein